MTACMGGRGRPDDAARDPASMAICIGVNSSVLGLVGLILVRDSSR